MMLMHSILSVLVFTSLVSSFIVFRNNKLNHKQLLSIQARRGPQEVKPEVPTFVVGENIPEEISKNNAIYDMVLVERISQPEKTSFGLFLPKVEGKDQKHLGKILSMPSNYGLESEQGRVAPIEEIMPYKVGDIVYIRV
jgi:co-chaperonin GroES (HSP10)